MSQNRRIALGLIRLSAYAPRKERRDLRIALALHCDAQGYVLGELFELGVSVLRDDLALRSLEDLALRSDAGVLFVAGAVDRMRILAIAQRTGLAIRRFHPRSSVR